MPRINLTCAGTVSLYRGDRLLSRHKSEAIAIEAADKYARSKKGTFELRLQYSGAQMRVVGITAPPVPPQLPDAPQNLLLVSSSDAEVSIDWDAAPRATGYTVFRNGEEYDTASASEYVDSDVTPEETYVYEIGSTNDVGASLSRSNALLVTVPAAAPQVPAKPATPEVDTLTARNVTLTVAATGDASEWTWFRDSVELGTTVIPEFTDDTVAPEAEYDYTVIASNAEGDSEASDPLEVTIPANSAPVWDLEEGQTFSGTVGESVNINLPSNCQDPDGDNVTFSIESGELPPGLVHSGSFIVGAYTADGDFQVVVRGDDGIDHADLTINFAVAAAADTTAPTIPQSPNATANGSTVTVDFAPSTDASGVSHYEVWRAGSGLIFSLRGTVAAPPFQESGVPEGQRNYKVLAVDASPQANKSDFSSVAQVTVTSSPPVPDVPINFDLSAVSSSRIDGVCEPGPNGAAPTAYQFGMSTVQAGPFTTFQTGPNPFFSRTGLSPGFYWFRVVAFNGAIPSAGGNVAGIATVGTKPAASFVIAASVTDFNAASAVPVGGGSARAVQQGEVIEIARRGHTAGNSNTLVIRNLQGPANGSNPPIIRGPQDGNVARICSANPNNQFKFILRACRNFEFDTACPLAPLEEDLKRYAIHVTHAFNAGSTENPNAFIKLQGNGGAQYTTSCRFVMRCIKVDGGFPDHTIGGIGVSTNDGSLASQYPGAWQEHMEFEDMFVVNTFQEGFYIGPNQYLVHRPNGGGIEEVPLRYIQTRRVWCENNGYSNFQGKSWYQGTADETATGNYVVDCVFLFGGVLMDQGHEVALRSLGGSFLFARNIVSDSGGTAMRLCTEEGCPASVVSIQRAYSNLIVRAGRGGGVGNGTGKVGINGAKGAQAGGAPVPTPVIDILGNTVWDSTSTDIQLNGTVSPNSKIRNNVVGGPSPQITPGGGSQSNNLTGTGSMFVGPVGDTGLGPNDPRLEYPDFNFRLVPGLANSAAVGTVGVDYPSYDLTGAPRTSPRKGAYN